MESALLERASGRCSWLSPALMDTVVCHKERGLACTERQTQLMEKMSWKALDFKRSFGLVTLGFSSSLVLQLAFRFPVPSNYPSQRRIPATCCWGLLAGAQHAVDLSP